MLIEQESFEDKMERKLVDFGEKLGTYRFFRLLKKRCDDISNPPWMNYWEAAMAYVAGLVILLIVFGETQKGFVVEMAEYLVPLTFLTLSIIMLRIFTTLLFTSFDFMLGKDEKLSNVKHKTGE